MFSYSSIEHMGSPPLHSASEAHSHVRRASPHAGAQPGEIRHILLRGTCVPDAPFTGHVADQGSVQGQPPCRLGLMFGVMAIVGMPPFGIFTSEF